MDAPIDVKQCTVATSDLLEADEGNLSLRNLYADKKTYVASWCGMTPILAVAGTRTGSLYYMYPEAGLLLSRFRQFPFLTECDQGR